MNTLDRINRLRKHYGLHAVGVAALQIEYRTYGSRAAYTTDPVHAILDGLDNLIGRRVSMCGNDKTKPQNYVGARLARLERHAEGIVPGLISVMNAENTFSTVPHPRGKKTARGWRQRAKYFFWLGAETEHLTA